MELRNLKPRKAINKAFLKIKPNRTEIENFKANLIRLLGKIDEIEREENQKNHLRDFLRDTYYKENHEINTKDTKDLVIHHGTTNKTDVGVIIEAKRPSNKPEMLKTDDINKRAFHEILLYYLRERITEKNINVKHLVISNVYEWFIFDEQVFERIFAQNKKLVKQFQDFELSKKSTDVFYKEIAEPFVADLKNEIEFTYFDIRDYEKALRNSDKKDDNQLIALFKLLSPEHLLKLPFANDSNSLDKRFYSELLHIIGLTETKDGSKKLIERNKDGERNAGSLLENAIVQLDSLDKISRLTNPSQFGSNMQERLFNVGLELCITWINRILFLKLLEAQLMAYHKGDKSFEFLNFKKIKDYDDLNSLFFLVLARKPDERLDEVKTAFSKVPYLNSSLFEPSDIEQTTIFISNLRDDKTLPIHSGTVLKGENGKKRTGEINPLEYLFEFLNAYDFASEGSEEIQEDNKTLINASVLGLIFEKINGYKDGSFFTPGFITMYMCRETIRKAVVQKFNDAKGWNCDDITALYDKIEDRNEANQIINDLKICDPAVGSGHFLVSALNEIIAIKNDLKILQDRDGRRLKEYHFEVVNDDLTVTDEDGELFEYNPKNKESQRIQEALFHEKQTIIENCLFGVDINPNSVKICRLRLWIELLKNAYYKNETELETLPNIDINIKCGNSLIYRYALDADIKKALKEKGWTVKSYRQAVSSYHNAKSKEEKRAMEALILEIKQQITFEIRRTDPLKKKFDKLSHELYNRFTGNFLFEPEGEYGKKASALAKKSKLEEATLRKEIETISKKMDEIKNSKIFSNPFEWRFEFPEVLNDVGDFIGFDVVIGNPPYGVKLSETEKEYLKNRFTTTTGEVEIYTFFIELAMADLLKRNGIFSFITTNTIYYLDKFSQIRKKAFLNNRVISLLELEKQVFADAPDIVPAIYVLQKSNIKDNVITLYKSTETKRVYNLVNFEGFNVNSIVQNKFETKTDFVFSLSTNEIKENLLKRISQFDKVKNSFKVVYGIKTGDNERFLSKEIKGDENWKKCSSSAKNIKKYAIDWQGDYLNVCNKLAGLSSINYEQPKILIQYIRKLSMPVRLVCAIDLNGEYYPLNNFSFIISEKDNSLKVLLGILNSRLMNWYFSNSFVDYNIKPKYIEQLPLPAELKSSDLENKVDEIITLKSKDKDIITSEIEKEIDQLVYQLYDLTEEEKNIVERSY